MWYAPVGSTEYVRNLHNDKKIKEYLLNENRFKNNTYPRFTKKVKRSDSYSELNSGNRSGVTNRRKPRRDNSNSRVILGKPMSMKTQSAVLVQIYRSYRKTALDVVSYAKNIKSSQVNKGRNYRKTRG